MKKKILAAFFALSLASCSLWQGGSSGGGNGKLELTPVTYGSIRGWSTDNQAEALAAFLKSCAVFNNQPDTAATGQGKLLAPVKVWKEVCRKAVALPDTAATAARTFFEENFVPFKALNGSSSVGLYTGYYEPLLKGSLTRKRPYIYPVYGLPPVGTTAYTRSQIDFNVLVGRAPVLAYVDDPVQLYFLHVQGSGRIQLDDGNVLRVGYAGSNGMAYVSIGKEMIKKGIFTKDQVSMQSIKQWLYDHPNDMWQAMWANPSYVYFRQIYGDPIGSQQAPLTAGRSMAVDVKFIPFGMPVFVDTILPPAEGLPLSIHRKLMIAQDTGGAIKGPLRADIFFGFGAEAEQRAGVMRSGGESVLLIPRALAAALE